MIKREAIKKLNDMIVDSQFAQQMGIKVFNGQASQKECEDLRKCGQDLIQAINIWMAEIQEDIIDA